MTVKPVISKMVAAGLSPRTVNKYAEYVRLVVASLVDNNTGEPIFERKWNRKLMGLPKVRKKDQRRPSLTTDVVNALIRKAESEKERVLYVLLAATGLRISEALALETKHFTNNGRTIVVKQQVERDEPVIRTELKTDAGDRQVDLHPAIAEYLQSYMTGKKGLLFATRIGTPYLHNNLGKRWLTPKLIELSADEPGMGWHGFRRFRKTWLRGKRCQEDINNYWMGHQPETMSELYSRLDEDLTTRLREAEIVGVGFDVPAPSAPRNVEELDLEIELQRQ
jgi:integrase